MSWSWELVRGSSINPSSLKFSALQNKENIAENELFKPDRPTPHAISVHTEDLVLLQDPFLFTKLKSNSTKFYGPMEPDGVNLKYWCLFNHIAKQIKDYSFSGNFTRPRGIPLLCKGPDDGVKGGTIVTKINYDESHLDYFHILNPEETGLGISEIDTGFSMYFKFMLDGNPVQHNGVDPTLWHHVDDPNGDFGTIIRIGENRELKFFIKYNGSPFDFISEGNKITSGVYHTACLTFNPTGNVLGMRIDNQPQTDSASESTTFDGIENNIFLGISQGINSGKLVGRYADVRWYRDLIFSNSQMDNIWNNGRSISPIAYGQLAVAGHSKFNDTVYAGGFDSTGFDSTGYDTT